MSKIEEIEIDGVKYKANSEDVLFCIYTKKYILKKKGSSRIVSGLEYIKISDFPETTEDDDGDSVPHPNAGYQYNRFLTTTTIVNGRDLDYIYNELPFVNLMTYQSGKITIPFADEKSRDRFINEHDLLVGENRTDQYFFRIEIEYMDTPMPYRKFNNIYRKMVPSDILMRDISDSNKRNEEFQKLKASVKKKNIEMGVDSMSHNELEGIKYTLGYEIETVSGRLEEEDVEGLNLAAVHDGSLRGPNREAPQGGEYVSGILYGDAGFKQLYDICKVLNKKCTLDHRAGVHVHIGSLNWSNEDIVYAYILGQIVEDDMYSMLPKSRKTNSYCRKITKLFNNGHIRELNDSLNRKLVHEVVLDKMYRKVFNEVSSGHQPSGRYNSTTDHPLGPKCGFDKSSQRYCWLNFVTLMFDTKRGGKDSLTLEIRSHSATMNYRKIRNWAKIWVAFCNFVDNYKRFIRLGYIEKNSGETVPITLENICLITYPKSGKLLSKYIRERKQLFQTSDESVDYPATVHEDLSIKEVINSGR